MAAAIGILVFNCFAVDIATKIDNILNTAVAEEVSIISVVLPYVRIPNSIANIVNPLINPEPANKGNKGLKTLTTNDINLLI